MDRRTPSQERRDGAGILARLLCANVGKQLPGRWDERSFNPDAIDERRSASIVEIHCRNWRSPYRLSIHSDRDVSIVGYGIFTPKQAAGHGELTDYLCERVPGGGRPTPKLWAWYREMDPPLQDFSQEETLIEVKKIMRHQTSEGDRAFRRAADDLIRLAVALHRWYSVQA